MRPVKTPRDRRAHARSLAFGAIAALSLALPLAGAGPVAAASGGGAPRRIAAVAPAASTAGGLNVSVGYAEDKETNNPNPAAFPIPWQGSPNVVFRGGPVVGQTQCGTLPSCFDAGAVRLDNPGSTDVLVSDVTVDVHSSITGGKVFDLWGSFTVPAGKSVILTENPPGDTASSDDFDTSGYPGNQCTPITVAPTVAVTIGGVKTTLADSTHVLDTGGIDRGYCLSGSAKNESIQWRAIGAAGSDTATLALSPASTAVSTGGHVTETATLTDGGGAPIPNATVNFSVTSGPNAGTTGSAVTNAAGQASFTYGDTAAGTDLVAASVTTVGSFQSQSLVQWGSGSPSWTGQDIGPVPLAGSDSQSGGVWTISGSGRDIGGTADQFHYVWQPLAADGHMSAHVLSQTNTNSRARAGVMFRQSTDPSSPFYGVFATPSSGIWVLERASYAANVVTVANPAGTVPVYLRLDRSGSTMTASTSSDGVTWTQIPGSTATLGVSGALLAGMAVTSHNTSALSTAKFDTVDLTGASNPPPPPNDFSISASPSSVSATAGTGASTTISTALVSGSAETVSLSASGLPSGVTAAFNPTSVTAGGSSALTFTTAASTAPGTYPITVTGAAPSATHTTSVSLTVNAVSSGGGLPSPWLDTDVGSPSPAGSASYANGVFTVKGSGADIWGTSDQFNYVYQPTSGNGTIVARVTSQSATGSSNSKAGVMWKASTTSGSPYFFISVGPTGIVKVQWNFGTSVQATTTYAYPNVWMKLVRSNSTFTAFLSTDGAAWTQVASTTLTTIPAAATVGLVECSHHTGTLGTATFEAVAFTAGP